MAPDKHSSDADDTWYLRAGPDTIYGELTLAMLMVWAEEGRLTAQSEVSINGRDWVAAEHLPELKMDWRVTLKSGAEYGPLNLLAVPVLFKRGVIDLGAVLENKITHRRIPVVSLLRDESQASPVDADGASVALPQGKPPPLLEPMSPPAPPVRRVRPPSPPVPPTAESQAQNPPMTREDGNRTEAPKIDSHLGRDPLLADAGRRVAELERANAALQRSLEDQETQLAARVLKLNSQLRESEKARNRLSLERESAPAADAKTVELMRALDALQASGKALRQDLSREREAHAQTRERVRQIEAELAQAMATSNSDAIEDWNLERSRLNAEVTAMRDQLAAEARVATEAQAQLDSLRTQLTKREAEWASELESKLASAKASASETAGAASAAATRIRELEKALADAQGQDAARTAELAALRTTLASLETDLASRAQEIETLKAAEALARAQVSEREALIEEAVARERESASERANLEAALEQAHARELEKLGTKAARSISALQKKWERQVAIQSDQKTRAVAKEQTLRQELRDVKSALVQARRDSAKNTKRVVALEQQLATLGMRRVEREADLQLEIERQAQMIAATQSAAEVRFDDDAADRLAEALDVQQKEWASRLDLACGEWEQRLTAQQHTFGEREAALTGEVDALRNELAQVQDALDERAMRLQALENDLKAALEARAELERSHQSAIEDQRSEWASRLGTEREEWERRLAMQQTELAAGEAALRKEIDELRGALAQRQQSAAAQREQVARLVAMQAEQDEALGVLRAEMDKRDALYREDAERAQARGREHEETLAQLLSDLAEARAAAAADAERIQSLEAGLAKRPIPSVPADAIEQLLQTVSRLTALEAPRQASEPANGWRLRMGDEAPIGPVPLAEIIRWAEECRIGPDHQIAGDNDDWRPVTSLPALGMEWTVALLDGTPYGPVNLKSIAEFIRDGVAADNPVIQNDRTGFKGAYASILTDEINRLRREHQRIADEANTRRQELGQILDRELRALQAALMPT